MKKLENRHINILVLRQAALHMPSPTTSPNGGDNRWNNAKHHQTVGYDIRESEKLGKRPNRCEGSGPQQTESQKGYTRSGNKKAKWTKGLRRALGLRIRFYKFLFHET